MKYKFNETNNITGYIKELLRQFNLPVYKVYKEGTTLINNRCYIKDNGIYKYFNGKFIEISPFEYNKKILNGSRNLKINSSVYDTYTHEYFGRYLRFLRDYKNLNLMPLYNCFSYNKPFELVYNLEISENERFDLITTDQHYDYYIIPVTFNTEYTIAIDSPRPFEMCTLIYTGSELLDISEELIKKTYIRKAGSKYTSPFIFKTINSADYDYWKYEDYFKLLLKLPKGINSSITILEGNYLSCTSIQTGALTGDYIVNDQFFDRASVQITPPTKLSLLEVNDGISYPFADRIVEYLLENAITNNEWIDGNIQRVQDIIYKNKSFKGIYGLWDSYLKNNIYNLCNTERMKINQAVITNADTHERIEKFKSVRFVDSNSDLLYYVDKDVESLLRSK